MVVKWPVFSFYVNHNRLSYQEIKEKILYSGGKNMHIIHVAYKQLIYQYLLYCNKTF